MDGINKIIFAMQVTIRQFVMCLVIKVWELSVEISLSKELTGNIP